MKKLIIFIAVLGLMGCDNTETTQQSDMEDAYWRYMYFTTRVFNSNSHTEVDTISHFGIPDKVYAVGNIKMLKYVYNTCTEKSPIKGDITFECGFIIKLKDGMTENISLLSIADCCVKPGKPKFPEHVEAPLKYTLPVWKY